MVGTNKPFVYSLDVQTIAEESSNMVPNAPLNRRALESNRVQTLGEFGTSHEAEQMVDRLSDAGFPDERIRIVLLGI
jgi:hypothetical protein